MDKLIRNLTAITPPVVNADTMEVDIGAGASKKATVEQIT